MKNYKFLLAVATLTCFLNRPAHANNEAFRLSCSILNQTLETTSVLNLIDWKVGDKMDYQVLAGGFGKIGTMIKSVTKDEGNALWMRQEMHLMSQNEIIDALIDRANGKILKLIRNGQETQIPDDQIEIISQEFTQVTVPAGTFDALHVIAKTKQISKLEIWANPPQTVMDGSLKQIMPTGFMTLTMELTAFQRGK